MRDGNPSKCLLMYHNPSSESVAWNLAALEITYGSSDTFASNSSYRKHLSLFIRISSCIRQLLHSLTLRMLASRYISPNKFTGSECPSILRRARDLRICLTIISAETINSAAEFSLPTSLRYPPLSTHTCEKIRSPTHTHIYIYIYLRELREHIDRQAHRRQNRL